MKKICLSLLLFSAIIKPEPEKKTFKEALKEAWKGNVFDSKKERNFMIISYVATGFIIFHTRSELKDF
jgi:hypothetical protein